MMNFRKTLPLLALAGLLSLTACSSPSSAGSAASSAAPSSSAKAASSAASQTGSQPDYTALLQALPENSSPSLENFSSVDLQGETVSQEIFSGHDLTMVNIWATYCGPCIREMPGLADISKEYQEKGVQIVGIISDAIGQNGTVSSKQIDTANEIISKTGADYPHLLPSYDLYMAELRNVYSVPQTLFVDKEGKVVGEPYSGSRSKEQWIKIIDTLLGELPQ